MIAALQGRPVMNVMVYALPVECNLDVIDLILCENLLVIHSHDLIIITGEYAAFQPENVGQTWD